MAFRFCWKMRRGFQSSRLHFWVDGHHLSCVSVLLDWFHFLAAQMDMQGASRAEKIFRPGEVAPESGVYKVMHQRHRESHFATLFQGERFPSCVQCGEA